MNPTYTRVYSVLGFMVLSIIQKNKSINGMMVIVCGVGFL